jgi:hypothetical protein
MNPRLIAVALALASPPPDAGRDAEALEALRTEVRKAVPPGWTVEITLVDRERPGRPGGCPALVIRSEQAIEVEYTLPGMPAGGEPSRRSEQVAVRLVAMPFLAADDHAAARAAEFRARDGRLAFVRTRLKAVPYASKSGDPIPPEDFRPRDEAERRLVVEYAYLWQQTETPPLPTHHARGLAFRLVVGEAMILRDAAKAREYGSILEAVRALVVPYESP